MDAFPVPHAPFPQHLRGQSAARPPSAQPRALPAGSPVPASPISPVRPRGSSRSSFRAAVLTSRTKKTLRFSSDTARCPPSNREIFVRFISFRNDEEGAGFGGRSPSREPREAAFISFLRSRPGAAPRSAAPSPWAARVPQGLFSRKPRSAMKSTVSREGKSARLTRAARGESQLPPCPARARSASPRCRREGSASRPGEDRSLRPPGARRPAAPRPRSARSLGAGPGLAGALRGTEAGTARERVPSPRPRRKAVLSCLQFSLFTFTLENIGPWPAKCARVSRWKAESDPALAAPRCPSSPHPAGPGSSALPAGCTCEGRGPLLAARSPRPRPPRGRNRFLCAHRLPLRAAGRRRAVPCRTAPSGAAPCRPPRHTEPRGAARRGGPAGARGRACAPGRSPCRPPPVPVPAARPPARSECRRSAFSFSQC